MILRRTVPASALALAAVLGLSPALAPARAEDAPKTDTTKTDAAAPAADAGPVGTDAGKALYTASFKDLKDQMASMEQFKGKVVVMYFWATWCVPCRIETPNLVKLDKLYKGKDVVVVGLALDNGDKVRTFVKENEIGYPVFYGGHDAVELGKTLGNSQGAIPYMVVIGKDGKLVKSYKGDIPNEELTKVIDPLIG